MADRYLPKAQFPGHRGEPSLVGREAPAMHQHDGKRIKAFILQPLQFAPGLLLVEWPDDASVGANPLVDLGDFPIEH